MKIEQVTNQRADVVSILSAEKLPVDDLPEALDSFLIATENGQNIAIAGIETYGEYGLLRSLAVLPEHRNKGVAGRLIDQLENRAKSQGLKALYLLTETAPEYFTRKGFQKIERDEIPDEIKQSSEFSHVCPVSATAMKKSIL